MSWKVCNHLDSRVIDVAIWWLSRYSLEKEGSFFYAASYLHGVEINKSYEEKSVMIPYYITLDNEY